MADITITKNHKPKKRYTNSTRKNENETRGRPKVDTWFQTMDKNMNCIFCGHNVWEHGATALQVVKPGKKNRIRAGVKYLNCNTCASDKGTSQVVCYKTTEEYVNRLRKAGYQVC